MLPLITHADLSLPIAYRDGAPVSARRFLTDVQTCARSLPDASHVLLTCQDRYAFAVGFGAALVRAQVCLLPSTHTEEMLAILGSQHAGLYCLTDEAVCAIQLPSTNIRPLLEADESAASRSAPVRVPMIAADRLAAVVYTSGSTGQPVAHAKAWGRLVSNVRSEGSRLGIVCGSGFSIVGTVPPQHMYGFESTVLIALQNGAAFHSGRPFYPADIERALASVPRPRALVTTPFHLRAFVTEVNSPLPLDLVVSATAPLALALALEVEQKMSACLLEIYGSTETGQLATRRTTETTAWTTFDGISLHQGAVATFASGEQIEGTVAINDLLELTSDRMFTLHGRTADMVNVAGKSTTLDYLNHQLLSIAGVHDGAFLVQGSETEGTGNTSRLAAVVVAPDHTLESLLAELRRKIAPAFLPRPLKLVAALPRNGTSKLPREALLAVIQTASHDQ
jgi:acyl-coenzyme A synthetase/AMP-(fatty) acid ligase